MNQPAIEYKMPERELKEVKAKLFEVIYLSLSKYETRSNDAGQFAIKLTDSILQDMQSWVDEKTSDGPFECKR